MLRFRLGFSLTPTWKITEKNMPTATTMNTKFCRSREESNDEAGSWRYRINRGKGTFQVGELVFVAVSLREKTFEITKKQMLLLVSRFTSK